VSDFVYTREVPKAWTDDLARLNVGENVSSLHLIWQAGMPWRPVQRWEVYEVLPATAVDRILTQEQILGKTDTLTQRLWRDLKGLNPRETGRWIPDNSVPQHMGGKRWKSFSIVSQEQWLLHKQTGGLPTRSWIIEGTAGGHAWQFGQFEKHFLLACGTDPETVEQLVDLWPVPGSLPYADYDQRVFNALAERDQLNTWKESLRWQDRNDHAVAADVLDRASRHRHRDMQSRMMTWIENQVGAMVSDIPRSRLPQWSDFRTVEKPAEDQDTVLESILNDA
jgi:hypothetical protein